VISGHQAAHQEKLVGNPSMRTFWMARRGSAHFLAILKVACVIACCGLAVWSGKALAETAEMAGPYPVGMKQLEYTDPTDGRHLAFALFYPATPDSAAAPYHMLFFTGLHLYVDAPVVADTLKRPLIMFSHGAGSNGLYYAWFGEYLAARGYLVAMLYHYRANTYDSTVMYTRSKLWQRPRDLTLDITNLLQDKVWGRTSTRTGLAWRGIRREDLPLCGSAEPRSIPTFIWPTRPDGGTTRWSPRICAQKLPLDAGPARDVRDSRVKAAFAMAPGDVPAFGMDEAGLRQLTVPTYIIVGARDTQAPARENSEFAARYIPHVQLDVLPGLVDHEIFVNECDALGRDTWPEACIDAPGIDRGKLHEYIGNAALKFFDVNLGVQR
jgi:predicted dienelactone hydrolase